jgi:hypothetical protein
VTRANVAILVMAVLAALAPAPARAQPGAAGAGLTSPYRGAAGSEAPGLDPAEIAELRDGDGMGLARVAEVQGYPGPRHVLDAWAAGQLRLADDQVAEIRRVAARMTTDARQAGRRVLEAEGDLARAFRDGAIDAAALGERVRRIAALRGELRAIHLRAHLATRAVLDPAQLARYAELRGYAPGTRHHGH